MIADTLADLVREPTGPELPVRLRGWDGGEVGPAGAPVVVPRSRTAPRRPLWDPEPRCRPALPGGLVA
jgi:cyclopropane-fatty-acyl-phospholipid synthase